MKSSRRTRKSKPEPLPLTYREQAQVNLDFYQQILRLQDWDITLSFERAFNVPLEGLGACTIRIGEQTAKIVIREPDDVSDEWETDGDLELTLLHELMHIKTHAAIEVGGKLETEKLVESMARIVLRLIRHMEEGGLL
jgi:hypothetical protein